MVDRRSRPPSRAVLGRRGGPPCQGESEGGEGPPCQGELEGGEGPPPRGSRRRRPPGPGIPGPVPRGGYRGGEAPGSPVYVTYRGRGGCSGGGPRPVLGLGTPPSMGIWGIRAPGAGKNTAFVRGARRGSRRSPWRQGGPGTAVGGVQGGEVELRGVEFIGTRPATTSSRPRKTSAATRSNRSMRRSAPFEGGAGRDLVRVAPCGAPGGAGCSSRDS